MRLLPEPDRFVLPLAAFVALGAYTSTQADPAGRAESAFLTLLVAGVLAAIAATGAGPGRSGTPELAATALLATATVWIAYQGPSRGAVVSLILVIGLAVSAARALLDGDGRLRSSGELGPDVTVPLALGLQLLMRSDLLLAPLVEARTLVSLLALPLASGWAVALLAARLGRRRALVAGGLAAVLAPGWTVTSTLALAALAAGALFADEKSPRALRWASVAALALLPMWHLPKGLLFAIAAIGVAAPSLTTSSLLLVAVVAVALLSPQVTGTIEAVRLWAVAILLVPAAVLAGPNGRWKMRLGALVALAAAMVSKAPEAMAAGVAVAAFAIPARGAAATLQRAWCAILLIGTTVLAAYPWVREDPRGDLLVLLGFSNEALALLTMLLLVAGGGYALDRFRSEFPGWVYRPALLACLVLAFGVARQVAPLAGTTVLVHSYEPATVTADSGAWRRAFAAETVSGVVLDSHLAGGIPIGPGTEAAIVELRAEGGELLAEWPLRVGYETGEWAASRPDLARSIGFMAPPPWVSRVAPAGDLFAHRFRARFAVPATGQAVAAAEVAIRPGERLPPGSRLSIYRLELRR